MKCGLRNGEGFVVAVAISSAAQFPTYVAQDGGNANTVFEGQRC